jgi:hypothetical protein
MLITNHMDVKMKTNNPTRYSHELTVKLPLELIADFNKLCFQFNGADGTDEEFAEYIMTVFLLNHSRNAGIDPAFEA